jgi:hypothetical protein
MWPALLEQVCTRSQSTEALLSNSIVQNVHMPSSGPCARTRDRFGSSCSPTCRETERRSDQREPCNTAWRTLGREIRLEVEGFTASQDTASTDIGRTILRGGPIVDMPRVAMEIGPHVRVIPLPGAPYELLLPLRPLPSDEDRYRILSGACSAGDPRAVHPTGPPHPPRPQWRPATQLRRHRLHPAQHRRTRHQQTQTIPRRSHSLRQTRLHLRRNDRRCLNPHLAPRPPSVIHRTGPSVDPGGGWLPYSVDASRVLTLCRAVFCAE